MQLRWETSFEEALDRVISLVDLIQSGSLSIDGQPVRPDARAVLKMEIEVSENGIELEFEIESKKAEGSVGASQDAPATSVEDAPAAPSEGEEQGLESSFRAEDAPPPQTWS